MAKQNIVGLATPWGFTSPNKMSNADMFYGPYNSRQDALDTVVLPLRKEGRTVGIKENGKVVEYWWESVTDLSDSALVPKVTITSSDGSLAYHSGGLLGSNITNVKQQLVVDTSSLSFPIDIPYEHDYDELYGVFITGIGELPRNFYYIQEDSISILDYTNELLIIIPEKFYITIKGSKFIQ